MVSSDSRSLLRPDNHRAHFLPVTIEGIVHDREGRNLVRTERERLRIKARKPGFMDPARSSAGSRMAQVLERPHVFIHSGRIRRLREHMIERNERHQSVIMHLAADQDAGMLRGDLRN